MRTRQSVIFRNKSVLALAVSAIIAGPDLAAQEDGELEEITVTGTRIRMTDGMAEPVPVTSVTPEELFNFNPGGTVAEQLDALPQFFSTRTAQRGANALWSDGGGSYVNMRGLGSNRTLVLLDGSRVTPADKGGIVNIDNLPTALVRSVDVVTGGASAAYGADALSGVTNFVLDREFEGLKVEVGTGMNEFNQDGKRWNFSIAGGQAFGRLNVIGSIESRHIDEVYRHASELDSDWYQNWGTIENPDPNGPERISVPWVAPIDRSPSGVISGTRTSLDGMQFTDDGKNIRPVILGDLTVGRFTSGGSDALRYSNATNSPINGAEVDNRSGFLGLQYGLTDSVNLIAQAMVGRTESKDHAEHESFNRAFPWFMTIYRENPFIPDSVARIMDENGVDSFRLSKDGSFLGDLEPSTLEYTKTVFTTESLRVGFEAVLANGWDLTGSWQTGESRKRGGEYPSTRVDREALARDAVRDPATGAIVCNVQLYNPTEAELAATPAIQGLTSSLTDEPLRSPIGLDNSIRDCVPYNAMGAGNMSPAAADYVHTPRIADTVVEQDFAEILMTGEAYQGWGYGPVSFATGFTYRESSFADRGLPASVDEFGPPFNNPAIGIRGIATAYSGGSPNLHHFATISSISGSYDVWEWFGELQVPIWESASGAQNLGGNLAYRSSDYSSSGRVETWKAGLELQVLDGLRFRATKSRDVREASFQERFDTDTGGAGVDDPFTGDLNLVVTALLGGNPLLRPEYADTHVFGLIFQPPWLSGFQMSADWYEVDLKDAVDSISAQQVVDQCFETGALCGNLTRDATGTLVAVAAPFLNLAEARAEGMDLEFAYSIEPDIFDAQFESFNVRALFGRMIERTDTPPGGSPIDRVGSSSLPEWTGNLTASYTIGQWGLQWQQRYIHETKRNINWVEGVDVDDNTNPTYSFTNLRFSYNGELNNGATWTTSLNVNNAFDKNPPKFGNINSFDEFGRRYHLSLNMTF